MVSPWEDGTKVIFIPGFHASLETREGNLLRARLNGGDPHGVFTVFNLRPEVPGWDSLHDVVLEELGTRWGNTWVQAIDAPVRHTWHLLHQGRAILDALKQAERSRAEMVEALELANSRNGADGHDPRSLSTYDILGALRLLERPLRSDIMHWEGGNIARAESWLREKADYAERWPEYPLMERYADGS